MGDRQALRLPPLPLPVGLGVGDRLLPAGDDQRGRAVDRRQRELPVLALQVGGDLLLPTLQGEHRPPGGQLPHQPAAMGDELGGIGEGEHTGDVGSRYLPNRVAGQQPRGQAHLPDEVVQRQLDREEGGLGKGGVLEGGGRLLSRGEDDLLERDAEQRIERGRGAVEACGEDRRRLVQLPAHAEALGALAAEQIGEPAWDGQGRGRAGSRGALGKGV